MVLKKNHEKLQIYTIISTWHHSRIQIRARTSKLLLRRFEFAVQCSGLKPCPMEEICRQGVDNDIGGSMGPYCHQYPWDIKS